MIVVYQKIVDIFSSSEVVILGIAIALNCRMRVTPFSKLENVAQDSLNRVILLCVVCGVFFSGDILYNFILNLTTERDSAN